MTTQPISHRRIHHSLLINRLLSLRESTSPFTLLLDSISQSSRPLVNEYIRRATQSKCTVVFVSYSTLRPPRSLPETGKFIKAWNKPIPELTREIITAATTTSSSSSSPAAATTAAAAVPRTLIIIDTLNPLCSTSSHEISFFLSSLITQTTSLLATYHLDVPLCPSPTTSKAAIYYPPTAPHPLTLLKYLTTTLITVHSLTHILLQKQARDRSALPPKWGLLEESPTGEMIEGAAVGLGGNSGRARRGRGGGRGGGIEGGGGAGGTAGIVLELEHRRKSGRPMGEWFYLSLDHHRHHNKNHHYKNNKRTKPSSPPTTTAASSATSSNISLLEDHPLYKLSEKVHNNTDNLNPDDIEHDTPQTTFDLNLTERQKKARDEVILPYFDAQKEEGYGHGGGGGRILFTPGREDDFDEEEDEI